MTTEQNIITLPSGLQYYRDWEREGHIEMVNAKTIDRYKELTDQHPDASQYGVFFAFSTEQFKSGYASLVERGYIKDGDKVFSARLGLFGKREEITRFYSFYDQREKLIKAECNPQEVYFYEYNNHECMFSYDGDEDAVKVVSDIWGKEEIKKLRRIGF